MLIVLQSEERIRLTGSGEGFGFEAEGETSLSPFHLLAASLATCTWSVLASWAEQARLELDDLEIGVEWEFGGDPYQVTRMTMKLVWPQLPESRRQAALRVAKQCTVHHTLEHSTTVETRI